MTQQLDVAAAADSEFEAAEAVIERGLSTFVDVGNALLSIQGHPEWYRPAGYPTFEDYCDRRWGLARRRAYQMMDAARVVGAIGVSKIFHMPANDSQARELVPVLRNEGPAAVAEVWQEAIETAPNGKVTAAHVERIVEQRVERSVERQLQTVRVVGPTAPAADAAIGNDRASIEARRERIAEMARASYREEVIAEEVGMTTKHVRYLLHSMGISTLSEKIGKTARLDANRIMDGVVTGAMPSMEAVGAIDWSALDRAHFEDWTAGLTEAIRELTRLRNKLRRLA